VELEHRMWKGDKALQRGRRHGWQRWV